MQRRERQRKPNDVIREDLDKFESFALHLVRERTTYNRGFHVESTLSHARERDATKRPRAIEISTKYLSLAQQDRDDTMERNGDLGQRCPRRKGSVTHRSRQYRERYPDSCFPSLISLLTRSAVSSRVFRNIFNWRAHLCDRFSRRDRGFSSLVDRSLERDTSLARFADFALCEMEKISRSEFPIMEALFFNSLYSGSYILVSFTLRRVTGVVTVARKREREGRERERKREREGGTRHLINNPFPHDDGDYRVEASRRLNYVYRTD